MKCCLVDKTRAEISRVLGFVPGSSTNLLCGPSQGSSCLLFVLRQCIRRLQAHLARHHTSIWWNNSPAQMCRGENEIAVISVPFFFFFKALWIGLCVVHTGWPCYFWCGTSCPTPDLHYFQELNTWFLQQLHLFPLSVLLGVTWRAQVAYSK